MMIEITNRLRSSLPHLILFEELPSEPNFDCRVGDILRRNDCFGHMHVVEAVNEEEVISRSHMGNYYVCPREELGIRFTPMDESA